MSRVRSRTVTLAATVALATGLVAACTIEDRTVDFDCPGPELCTEDGGSTGSGGKSSSGGSQSNGGSTASGGKGSGGTSNTGGKGSGGTSSTGGRASGGAASGGAPGSGGTGGSATLADAILRHAEANCRLGQGCAKFYVSVVFGDMDACVERTALANAWMSTLPGSTWNKAFYDRCADAWEAAIEDKNCDAFYEPTAPEGCRSPGTRANGQPCNSYNQCASLYCDTEGYDCGTCTAQPSPGGTCVINLDCREGEFCGTDGVCYEPLPLGADCSASPTHCNDPLSCHNGTCVRSPFEAGDTCNSAEGLFCDWTYGVTCNGTQCVAIPSTTAGGSCPQGTVCLDSASCVSGVCQAAGESGEQCGSATGTNCKWPSVCIGGYCELPEDAVLCGSGPTPPGN